MKPLLKLAACLLAVLIFSAAAALAWDRGDRAAGGQAPPAAGSNAAQAR